MPQISTVKYSDIQKAKRYDAEYFKPEYLEIDKILSKFGDTKKLEDISEIITNGHTPRYADLSVGEIKFLTAEHIEDFKIKTQNTKFIKREPHEKELKRTKLEMGDLIVTIKGKIGNFAVVGFDTKGEFNINQDVGRIVLRENFNPYYVAGFLNSKFGKLQSIRVSTGQINPFLGLGNLKTLKIPFVDIKFQTKIEQAIKEAHQKQEQSKQLYKEAEELLLKELDLLDYKPVHNLSFETTANEVESSKRFDSEYFQPEYLEVIKKIKSYKGGFDIIKNLFNFNKKNFFPKENELYSYLPLSKVSNNGEINNSEEELGQNLPTRARRKVKQGEVILSSISGSLETSAIIGKEHNNFIVSNGFYVFSSEKINSETLLLFFKSKPIIGLLQRISKGAILGGYDLTAFEKLEIPLIKDDIQKEISKKIIQSHEARKESKQLLEKAKKMVEEEIEK